MSDSSVSVQLFRRKFSQVTWVALHFPYPLLSCCGPSSLESLISSQARDTILKFYFFFLKGKGRFLCSFSWVLSSITTSLPLSLISGIEVIRTSSAINKAKIFPPGYHSLNINITFLWKFWRGEFIGYKAPILVRPVILLSSEMWLFILKTPHPQQKSPTLIRVCKFKQKNLLIALIGYVPCMVWRPCASPWVSLKHSFYFFD